MSKSKLIISAVIYFFGVYYLFQPSPSLPTLDDAVRSDEPGDTWQHPDQSAYYTHRKNRQEILGELQDKFSLSSVSLFSYRLNYRPEEVGEYVRDQLRSYYLEEVVHPLRESLYINVLDPEKSPMIDDEARDSAKMYFKKEFFPIKVTLRPVYSTPLGRLLVWTLIFPSAYLTFLSVKKTIALVE